MQTVADLIDRNANYFPDVEAFVCDNQRLTYSDYAERCRRLSFSLHSLGLKHQDRVGIFSTNNIEFY